ncbi:MULTISPECIES: DNA gyrase subunit A [unclassified Pseudobutyrivibrio]|uniref:DNA gyrase subunit A n=1 Tax=unclassified Pseudobutyrivibrio TaxID=2638619 RepID=UPI0005D182D2|nr:MULTISPECIES: DNA gyrase subunit A [unclassified Pseudobutyrivibrio]SET29494.1 DNA gyrase subunit A [Pseudobutyrivibrio sp. C4]SFO51395.1 DNA gyrase subunit A [Pseudobutyrivibrio sp. JW11]
MDDKIFDNIHDVDLKQTMETSYIDYAMSVIASRALPDVRDGLKPVQRRVLFSMIELNNGPDKPHRKCARIVGDTMGKYHPHGDSSIYGALVNMAQEWNTRYPLVDGHGNFGSVDGDGAAAMRYTEARLSKISMTMFGINYKDEKFTLGKDIDMDGVDFMPNFDETEKEPTVLPARYPNLLVNGTTGIAVGMATNIPPHNLREVIGAVNKIIDNQIEEDRDTEIDELLDIVKGPDFPTGGVILGKAGIEEAYRTGRAKIRVRAVSEIEPMDNGKNRIVVTELPYMVNKARLIEKIAELHKDKRIDGITDLRDESSREGMRICIELRRDVNPNIILNQLYKHTQLQDTFGVIMLALVDNQPKILSLKEMLVHYLNHQKDVVTRRTKYELNKAEERAHILEGLLIALDNIDEVIQIIRSSADVATAKATLMERFGLSDAQAQAIVDMRLRALTGLERDKIQQEYNELQVLIGKLKAILSDEKVLLSVIKTEITEIADKYGDDRRTSIGFDEYDINMEDMIPVTNTVVTFTKLGYIKRMNEDNFKTQHRGGKGIKGMDTIDDDYVVEMLMMSSHDYLLFFTNKGRVYRIKAYEIPESSRTSRGIAVVNILQLQPDEKVTAMIPVEDYSEDKYLFMATADGFVKKTKITEYENIRKNGLTAITLRDDDMLIEVKLTDGDEDVIMVTKYGQAIRFSETEVRPTGRATMGVIGMNLAADDMIIGMQLISQGESLMTVSENGLGKCTLMTEFNTIHRGGKGVKCYKITEKTGNLIGAKAVEKDDEVMLINDAGTIIRINVAGTALLSRITSGVKLIDLKENTKLISIAKVRKSDTILAEEVEELNEGSTTES